MTLRELLPPKLVEVSNYIHALHPSAASTAIALLRAALPRHSACMWSERGTRLSAPAAMTIRRPDKHNRLIMLETAKSSKNGQSRY